ncbi:hypothetical protein [Streptomyces sp. NPDC001083]|uniref:hypothetical protein n=1 Tax=Streptomyces sp. NPDC001083 TaxID=3364545 RepID=UPI0036C46A0C
MDWHRVLFSWKATDVHGQVAAPVGERRLVLRRGSGRALVLSAARFEELRTTVSDTLEKGSCMTAVMVELTRRPQIPAGHDPTSSWSTT